MNRDNCPPGIQPIYKMPVRVIDDVVYIDRVRPRA